MDQFQSRANVEVQIFTIDCLRPNLLFNFPIITYLPFYRQPNCVLEFVIVGTKSSLEYRCHPEVPQFLVYSLWLTTWGSRSCNFQIRILLTGCNSLCQAHLSEGPQPLSIVISPTKSLIAA